MMIKNNKFEITVITLRTAQHSISHLKYKTLKTLVVFHNGSNCDYHFIIKKLTYKCKHRKVYQIFSTNRKKNFNIIKK